MKALCYIQARGGSKRFPRKNLALWNGIPMLGDAITKAQATGLFDKIVVSSDNAEILSVAWEYGAIPIWRSGLASNDAATDTDVAVEVLGYFPEYENICKLYPCVPLLDYHDIVNAFMLFDNMEIAGIYSTGTDGVDAGAFYIFSHKAFEDIGTISLQDFPWWKFPIEIVQDINTPEDLEEAKKKAVR